MSSPILLLQMPDFAMENILKNCDFRSIQVLRKVCRDLRNFIDSNKPETTISKVVIKVVRDTVLFMIRFAKKSRYICIFYEKHEKGYSIYWEKNGLEQKKLMENDDFIEAFCRDFEIVVRHRKLSILKELRINFSEFEPKFLENFKKVLESRSSLLKVATFHIEIFGMYQVMAILPFIDPKPLEKIMIVNSGGRKKIKVAEIAKLEQWKQAQELIIDREFLICEGSCTIPDNVLCQCEAPIQVFTGFSTVHVAFRTVTWEMVMELREAFLHSANLKYIQIIFYGSSPTSRLIETFGQPLLSTDMLAADSRRWFFRIPNTDRVFSIEVNTHFRFNYLCVELIQYADIPQNVVVLD